MPELTSDKLQDLTDRLRDFADERDWNQFHSPKNLAMALVAEAGELAEVFQWLTEAQSQALSAEQHAHAEQEMADVLLYLLRLADKLGVNLLDAATRKMQVNARKYPVATARGHARKYQAP